MDSKSLIHHDDKPKLLRALLLRHRHVNENAHGFPFGTRRKFSSYTSLQVTSIEYTLSFEIFYSPLSSSNHHTFHIVHSCHTVSWFLLLLLLLFDVPFPPFGTTMAIYIFEYFFYTMGVQTGWKLDFTVTVSRERSIF